jgi:predicted GNAT family acetyltransferase
MTDTFRHNAKLSRYELEVDGLLAFADYRRSGERLIIPHVESDPALRGQGAAARLMRTSSPRRPARRACASPRCAPTRPPG